MSNSAATTVIPKQELPAATNEGDDIDGSTRSGSLTAGHYKRQNKTDPLLLFTERWTTPTLSPSQLPPPQPPTPNTAKSSKSASETDLVQKPTGSVHSSAPSSGRVDDDDDGSSLLHYPPSSTLLGRFVRYLKAEISYTDEFLSEDSYAMKRERLRNFLSVPREFERLMLYGYFICLDSFLNIFTILPIRLFGSLLSLPRLLL
jgi:hypothetical protein